MIFQKHCIVKLWLELLNDLTQLTNEKIYSLQIFKNLEFCKKRKQWKEQDKTKNKASKPAQQSQKVSKSTSQQASKPARQKASNPASQQALLYGSLERKPG